MTTAISILRAALPVLALCSAARAADTVGEVDTVFKFIGPDHKIVVEAYDDPKVSGVTCSTFRPHSLSCWAKVLAGGNAAIDCCR